MPAAATNSLIEITCRKCRFTFKVQARFAGKMGTCPKAGCRAKYRVPLAAGRPAQADDSAPSPVPPPIGRAKRSPSKTSPRSTAEPKRRLLIIAASLTGVVSILAITAAAIFRPNAGDRSNAAGNQANESPSNESKPTGEQVAARKKAHRAAAMQAFHADVQPFLKKYCFECHGPKEQMEGIALHTLKDQTSVFGNRKIWEKIHRVVTAKAMPPQDHKLKPTRQERTQVAKWIQNSVFYVDCKLVDDPGRVTIRRLNRSEFNNTIRDLVGVDFEPAKDFPSDDVGYGFDNIGDVLSLPPLLMEKYLDAAEQIAAKAIVLDDAKKKTQRQIASKLQASRGAGGLTGNGFRSLASTGEVYSMFSFPKSGEYTLRAEAAADQAGGELAKMEFRIDNRAVKVFEVKGQRRPDVYVLKLKVTQGRHKFAAAFINDYYNPKARRRSDRDRNLAVRYLEVQGPIGIRISEPTEIHKRIIFTRPGPNRSVKQTAEEIVARFLPRAFRRPVTDAEIRKYAQLVELVVQKGDSFERGVQVALTGILVSPHFLFRIEQDRKPNNPDAKRTLNEYELASRLSYFLWSSMPDKQLFDLAEAGQLSNPAVLKQQVKRMIADPKSTALVQNFGAQWLNLRILDEVTPDKKRFPFDDKLRRDMKRETELFFAEIMRQDRSILEFLDARFTFLNERLAKHYGIPGVKGDEFRKVTLTGNQRAGVLTHASILTLTSNPTRTSPVKRGKWILENIFDEPPPDPPPNVPVLDEEKIASGNLSLRKQLEIHRKNAVCASCHNVMDTIGFGFENFDAVGRWRDKDGKSPIDSSGKLPDGSKFSDPLQLVKILKQRKNDFARCFSRKMLTFALGRGLEYYDKCAVDDITKAAATDGFRFSAIVTAIVTSDPFLMRRGDAGTQK